MVTRFTPGMVATRRRCPCSATGAWFSSTDTATSFTASDTALAAMAVFHGHSRQSYEMTVVRPTLDTRGLLWDRRIAPSVHYFNYGDETERFIAASIFRPFLDQDSPEIAQTTPTGAVDAGGTK